MNSPDIWRIGRGRQTSEDGEDIMIKRPTGIIVFSLIFAALFILRMIRMIALFVESGHIQHSLISGGHQSLLRLVSLVPSLCLSVLFVWMIVDIYRYKKWAYYFLILFSAKSIFSTTIALFQGSGIRGYIPFLVEILLSSALIVYFIQPRIRSLFVPAFDSKERWSLGVLLLAWFLIIPAVFYLCGSIVREEALLSLTALAFGWIYHLVDILCGVGLLFKNDRMRYFTIGFTCFTVFISLIGYNLTLEETIKTTILNGLIVFFLTRQKVIEQFRK